MRPIKRLHTISAAHTNLELESESNTNHNTNTNTMRNVNGNDNDFLVARNFCIANNIKPNSSDSLMSSFISSFKLNPEHAQLVIYKPLLPIPCIIPSVPVPSLSNNVHNTTEDEDVDKDVDINMGI